MGLYRVGRGFEWRATKVSIKLIKFAGGVPDGCSPPAKPCTFRHVTAVGEATKPIVLVLGLQGLESVQVQAAALPPPLPKYNAVLTPVDLGFGGVIYKLTTFTRRTGRLETELWLTQGSRRQLIAVQGNADAGWVVDWAGDLDGDGKLDLLVTGGDTDNITRLMLSRARGLVSLWLLLHRGDSTAWSRLQQQRRVKFGVYVPPIARARWMGHPSGVGWWSENRQQQMRTKKQVPPLRCGMKSKWSGQRQERNTEILSEAQNDGVLVRVAGEGEVN